MKYYVGIDIGGTKIAYGLFDEKRNLLQKKQTASDDKKEAEEFFSPVIDMIHEFMQEAEKQGGSVEGIGIGITGFVDFEKGALTRASHASEINMV